MSRATRRHVRAKARELAAASLSAPAQISATTSTVGYPGLGNGWSTNGYLGADFSRLRGYTYWPQLDSRKTVSSWTRTEFIRRCRFLYANVGLVRRLINGMARMVVGTGLDVHPTTNDREWNKLAHEAFLNRTSSRSVFDIGGRYNFWKSQLTIKRWQFRDADAAVALTSSPADLAQFAFYEGHQIGSGLVAPGEESSWNDGVLVNKHNRPIAYRILGDAGAQTDISAQDLIFFADYESGGQTRGSGVLWHAINKLVDTGEIITAITTGIKQFNQIGYAIETDIGGTAPTTAGPESILGTAARINVGDGQQVTVDRVYGGGGAVPKLDPGQKLRAILDSRPHPNNLEFLDYLVRDIAWGAGLSPEVIWNIATLGGANTRFILADTQGWIEEQQQELIDLYCGRVYLYTIAKEMKSGRLRRPTDEQWWKHAWIPPPRLTVDFGREGKLHIEQLKMGMITMKKFYGWQGEDANEQINQWLDEVADFKAGLNSENGRARTAENRNLTWDDVQSFRNSVGFRPDITTAAEIAEDGLSADPATASAELAALVKDPARALSLLKTLSKSDA